MSNFTDQNPPNLTADSLRHAIANGEIHLQFQPIVNLTSQRIQGLESLMRWTHPVYGAIPPPVFLPLAHNSGLILELSNHALLQSCRALKKLRKSVGLEHDLFISVNFTAQDFTDENFLDHLYMALSQTDLHPRNLRLELTEHVLLSDSAGAAKTLALCRNTGMGITVDDYGTNSEFAEKLHHYPVDTVKIPPHLVRAFLSDKNAYDYVSALITHAHKLNLTISAVGVERMEEAEALYHMGCHLAQGYLFSPPLDEDMLKDLFLPQTKAAEFA